MKSLQLKEILERTGGQVVQGKGNITISKATTRVKRVRDNTLLFDFRARKKSLQSLKDYMCAVITKNPQKFAGLGAGVTVIKVRDAKAAYWAFVSYYRSLFNLPVIGITGTCGKTTTKDMIKHILDSKYRVQATVRSQNDSVYNLKYLTGIDEATDAAVIEMGVAYPGDLLTCCRHFRPHIGVITKIGVDHLLGCKSLEGYIKAKAEILEGMSYSGTLILNADDENIRKIDLSPFKGQVVYFGTHRKAQFRASNIRYFQNGMKYLLHYKRRVYPAFIPGLGHHNVYNALAAIAAVHALGFEVYEAVRLLRSYTYLESHLQIRKGLNGCLVIDDTWSTNPTSLQAALEVLQKVAGRRKKIAVLGYIDELGEHSAHYHSLIGDKVYRIRVDMLITIGDEAKPIADRVVDRGMNPNKVYCCDTSQELFDILSPHLDSETVVLIKKSMHTSYKQLMKRFIAES